MWAGLRPAQRAGSLSTRVTFINLLPVLLAAGVVTTTR